MPPKRTKKATESGGTTRRSARLAAIKNSLPTSSGEKKTVSAKQNKKASQKASGKQAHKAQEFDKRPLKSIEKTPKKRAGNAQTKSSSKKEQSQTLANVVPEGEATNTHSESDNATRDALVDDKVAEQSSKQTTCKSQAQLSAANLKRKLSDVEEVTHFVIEGATPKARRCDTGKLIQPLYVVKSLGY